MCRLWATELSTIKPQLDAHNVGLVGVGLESLGVEAFIDGGYFKGDLYIDTEKKCYKDLEFKKYNLLTLAGGLVAAETRKSLAKSNSMGLQGDMKGDGMQIGGTIVVSSGGEKMLFCHKQKSPGDHTNVEAVLESLGIKSDAGEPCGGATAEGAQ